MTSTMTVERADGSLFSSLKVRKIEPLTQDAVAITFDVPDELSADYSYAAGQHVIVRRQLGDVEVRRTYSICSSEHAGVIRIGVRRVDGGEISTWLTLEAAVGEEIEVSRPTGQFGSNLAAASVRHIGLVAVGSGITPVLSLATTHLERDDDTLVTLIVGNRTASTTMFAEELASLKDRFLGRLHLAHIMTRESLPAPIMNGRIDDAHMSELLERVLPVADIDQWYLCGPLGAVESARRALEEAGTPADSVHREVFHADPPKGWVEVPVIDSAEVVVVLNGRSTTLGSADLGGSILDGLLAHRRDAPYSCRNGVCGTCKARCLEGEVSMASTWALDDREIADGVVLTCQAAPVTDHVRLEFL